MEIIAKFMAFCYFSFMIPTYKIDYKASIPFEIKKIERQNPFIQSPHPHRHDFYELVYIKQARGYHHIDFQRHEILPNTIYFITPGQVHMLDTEGEIDGVYITFNEEFLSEHLNNFSFTDFSYFFSYERPHILPVAKQKEIFSLFAKLNTEFTGNLIGREASLRSYLVILLYELEKLYRQHYASEEESVDATHLVVKFKKILDCEFTGSRFVKYYAKKLSITPNHLNELVKNATGKSAGVFIRQRALLEAKRLLSQSELTIAQISHQLDFREPAHFSNFFKKYTGDTPKTFRENLA